MSLPNVNIQLGNGNIGSVSLSDDGIAGLILTGDESSMGLEETHVFSSTKDLQKYKINERTHPLVYKDISAFYATAGEGAELHVMIVPQEMSLTEICGNYDESPLNKLINSAAGRIRLVGINRNTPFDYEPQIMDDNGMDSDVITAISAANGVAQNAMGKIAPFVVFLPAYAWTGTTKPLYYPRESSYSNVSLVMASDGLLRGESYYSAAIGQVLGRSAISPVNISIARVRDGAIAAKGFLMDGSRPEDHFSEWNLLHDAGYIFYRSYIGKNGYYLNDDATATATTDDYHRLSLVRVIQKAVVIAYKTYIDEILDSISIDPETGYLSQPLCKSFEQSIIRSVGSQMANEISGFTAYVNPEQDLITNGTLNIECRIVPTALLKEINVNLSFNNPTNS